jgi:hypothetical protein
MFWFWLNVPLGALIFLAVSGIPLRLVLRHPDLAPARPTVGQDGTARLVARPANPEESRPMAAAAGRDEVRQAVRTAA